MLERLLDADAVDRYRAVTGDGRHLLIPVSHPDRARQVLDAPLVEARVAPNPRRPPRQRIRDRLRGRVPDRALAALPEGWDRVGEVVLVRLPDPLGEHASTVAAAYGEILDARAVLELERAEGPLREPVTRHLWGDEDTETVHREAGITYHLDPSRVLFSVGNHHERHRLREAIAPGEHVVDLFAGIGYFTLPLAHEGARVTACELNPTAAGYLETNLAANDVEDRVEIRQGDARDVAPTGVADRVLMGYFPGTAEFLPTALDALSPAGGRLHYHTTAPAPTPVETAWRTLRDEPALAGVEASLIQGRRVKGYAPGVAHVVLDVEVHR